VNLNESIVEDDALMRFGGAGSAVGHGASSAELRRVKPHLAPGEPSADRCF
jgi:hypothetical protein